MNKESQEFQEKKKLIQLKKEMNDSYHKNRMIELEFERETGKLQHDKIMERNRIKFAEERKLLNQRRYT